MCVSFCCGTPPNDFSLSRAQRGLDFPHFTTPSADALQSAKRLYHSDSHIYQRTKCPTIRVGVAGIVQGSVVGV